MAMAMAMAIAMAMAMAMAMAIRRLLKRWNSNAFLSVGIPTLKKALEFQGLNHISYNMKSLNNTKC